ncbi:hypothetical protein PENANT_c022G03109 [Penicillium antarcticum]|uniref:Short-chain dehydrogenase n=1 Tax=Penicillium antarcticum TaxID=416450 RepID=A0A1V6PZR7_9EURO|nr:uncharacterized protein N7508_002884 [Penicillium antarcticum]KAJ5312054.1 hypothetical protein N7508_002884 [Penicillium antarcticum]OQD82277.1 hypothetical protein PENANT_c022G03109 [Penicillium antarcticum]
MTSWSWSSTGTEVVHEFEGRIRGRTFLITGPSDGGIGAETALCLASKSPSTVILAGRDRVKIQPVIDKITEINSNIKAVFVSLDLSDQFSIRAAAAEINGHFDRIDVLINNAAIMACPYGTTKDGFEVQFGTNFLGPFLLTGLLLPKLRAAGPGARIVNVSSSAHRFEGIRFEDIDFEGGTAYDTWKAYGQSKTALILMANHLARRIPSRDIASFAIHPGSIASGLQRHVDSESISDARVKSQSITDFEVADRKTLQQGCATTLFAALNPALEGDATYQVNMVLPANIPSFLDLSGLYFSDCQLKNPAIHACGAETADRLWHLGEQLLGEDFNL